MEKLSNFTNIQMEFIKNIRNYANFIFEILILINMKYQLFIWHIKTDWNINLIYYDKIKVLIMIVRKGNLMALV